MNAGGADRPMTRAEARALRASQAAAGGAPGSDAPARASQSGSTDRRSAAGDLPVWPAEPPPVRELPGGRPPFASAPPAVTPAAAPDDAAAAAVAPTPTTVTTRPSPAAQQTNTAKQTNAAQSMATADRTTPAAGSSTALGSDSNDEVLASTVLSPLGVAEASTSGASGEEPPTSGGAKRKPRRRVTVTGVIGELLITFGVVVLLYVAWQLWIGDWIYSSQHNAEGAAQSQQWQADFEAGNIEVPEPVKDPETETWVPPVIPEPGDTVEFAQMLIPRFGEDYSVKMAGGVTRSGTLDPIGIGHYPGTAMPGEVGNFALAAHRTTWGKPFNLIADLQLDDPIVVETEAGWYTYRFRTLEYVTPDQVDVLLSVPQAPDVPPGGKYITLTSCSPMYSLAERIVAYGVFDSFQPRSEGPPAWIKEGA